MPTFAKLTRTAVLAAVLMAFLPSGRAADLDKLAPADADMVLTIDVQAVLASKAFQKHGAALLQEALKTPESVAFLKATGLDPMKDFTRVTVTLAGGFVDPKAPFGESLRVGVVVRGNFDVDRLQKAIEAAGAKEGNQFKVVRAGERTYYTLPTQPGQSVTATFVDKGAFVLGNDLEFVKAVVTGKKAEATAAAKALRKATDKVGADATAFAALALPEPLQKHLAEIEVPNPLDGGKMSTPFRALATKLEAASVAINVSDALDVTLTVHTTDAETAKILNQLAGLGLLVLKQAGAASPEAKPLVDAVLKDLKTAAADTAFHLKARLTEDLLKKLLPGAR